MESYPKSLQRWFLTFPPANTFTPDPCFGQFLPYSERQTGCSLIEFHGDARTAFLPKVLGLVGAPSSFQEILD